MYWQKSCEKFKKMSIFIFCKITEKYFIVVCYNLNKVKKGGRGMAYLYGASVQGIQDFIFKTNRLQEIVGASEIVKRVAKEFELLSGYKEGDSHILLNAAGNIKAIFDDKGLLEKVVLEFSKHIQQKAYGITISQAVVKISDAYTQEDINELERRLKIQRNKPGIPLDSSINMTHLAPATAKPATKYSKIQNKTVAIDKATEQKRGAYQRFLADNPRNKEFSNISDFSNNKNKIAIIHADGNGLGQLIPKIGNSLSSFSVALDHATKEAFDKARDESMSIREIVLGGDDVTVICNANDALPFIERFLTHFEEETSKIEELKGIVSHLTACAGIAYCNEKYPFHYAVDLAEKLCGVAKNHSNREASCIMFHNIQSSYYQSWEKFIEDELTIANDQQVIRCDFGAYYLDKKEEACISDFIHTVEAYRCDGSPISRLRNWLSELYRSDKNAKNLLDRINKITKESGKWNCDIMDKNLKFFHKDLSNDTLIVQKDGYKKTPIYDILQILSVTDGGEK